MFIDDRDIEELRAIHEEEFHETLSHKEAREMGARILRLYELFMQPLATDEAKEKY